MSSGKSKHKHSYFSYYTGKLFSAIREEGIFQAIKKIKNKLPFLINYYSSVPKNREAEITDYIEYLKELFNKKQYAFIDIMYPPLGWNNTLFQRFQHFSLQASQLSGFAFFGGHPMVDKLTIYTQINKNFHVFDATDSELVKAITDFLASRSERKIVRVQSIDNFTTVEDIEKLLEKGFEVIYEYIDEITNEISGDIPDFVIARHKWCIENPTVLTAATSEKLYRNAKTYNAANLVLSTNGVDYNYWHDNKRLSAPEILKNIIGKKHIIAYHGALAPWLDFNLLKRIADDGRFILLLIGYPHGNIPELKELKKHPNIIFAGRVPYNQLNRYSAFYDVGIIPFTVNDITQSVSPLKIFEYMASGIPVVSTAINECKKYQSCLIAADHDEFIKLLEKAVSLKNDSSYLQMLNTDALSNDWQKIYRELIFRIIKN